MNKWDASYIPRKTNQGVRRIASINFKDIVTTSRKFKRKYRRGGGGGADYDRSSSSVMSMNSSSIEILKTKELRKFPNDLLTVESQGTCEARKAEWVMKLKMDHQINLISCQETRFVNSLNVNVDLFWNNSPMEFVSVDANGDGDENSKKFHSMINVKRKKM
ncbi:hypothetical protein L2E82_44553 [Cichorium intybus]|uniref:Uncharacterized protein n=1 Tax=Cichorium intybus TaxID=13427 RepID=A0ACB8ZQM7_CICIN|nr:hypothetical protein L2E82_44553 [Cichorium intybus]